MSLLQTFRFAALIGKLLKIPRWNAAKVQRLQRRRLGRLVRWAIDHSPFYRERYRGIDRHRFDLCQLPPVTKQELMANFDQVVTDPQVRRSDVENFLAHPENLGHWLLGRYAVSHTSGCQGQPMLIVQDRLSLSVFYALMCSRANPAGTPGVIEGIRRLWKPVKIAVVTMDRGFYPSGAATEFMPELVGRFVHIQRYSSMQKDLIDQLNRFQPNVLVS